MDSFDMPSVSDDDIRRIVREEIAKVYATAEQYRDWNMRQLTALRLEINELREEVRNGYRR